MKYPRHTMEIKGFATTLSTLNSHEPSARRNKWAEERKCKTQGFSNQCLLHGETLVSRAEDAEETRGAWKPKQSARTATATKGVERRETK